MRVCKHCLIIQLVWYNSCPYTRYNCFCFVFVFVFFFSPHVPAYDLFNVFLYIYMSIYGCSSIYISLCIVVIYVAFNFKVAFASLNFGF